MPRRLLVLGVLLGVVSACGLKAPQGGGGGGGTPAAGRMVTMGAIVIRSSGSAAFYGYTILVGTDGTASFSTGKGTGSGTLSALLTQRLFADVARAQPFTGLPATRCAKSPTGGTTLTITNRGLTTPDLECPGNALEATLLADVHDVARALGIRAVPHGQGSTPPALPQL